MAGTMTSLYLYYKHRDHRHDYIRQEWQKSSVTALDLTKDPQTQRIIRVFSDLAGVGAAAGHSGSVVAEGRQTGQDEVDGADLESHTSQQQPVVGGERSGTEQGPEHVERQRG